MLHAHGAGGHRHGYAVRARAVQPVGVVSGDDVSQAPRPGDNEALLAEATAVLGPGTVRRLRTIAPDECLPLLRDYVADVRSLRAFDMRTRRRMWVLIGVSTLFSVLVSALVSRILWLFGPSTFPMWLAIGESIVASLLSAFVLHPKNLAWSADPDHRPSAEWRLIAVLLSFLVSGQLAVAVFKPLQARYGGMTTLPGIALVPYIELGALLQLTAVAYAAALELPLVIIAADHFAVRRRRRFRRVLAVQALRRVTAHLATMSHARATLPAGRLIRALASAAWHIEQEFVDATAGVSDPLTREVRTFGYAVGDSVRKMAVPLLSSTPTERATLVERLDEWTAAVIAGAWDHVTDRGVAQRPERLWPQWQQDAQQRLRLAAWFTTLGITGILVWKLDNVPGITLVQVLSTASPLFAVLVAFAGSLELFKRRDK